MILILETAGTSMPLWKENPNSYGQPRLLRLAMAEIDPATGVMSMSDYAAPTCVLVRPPVSVTREATEFHGITDAHAASGMSTEAAFATFEARLRRASVVAGYSVDFHRRVMERTATLLDKSIEWPAKVCLMRAAAPVVQIWKQRNGQWAWPKFTHAYRVLFNEDFAAPVEPCQAGLALVIGAARVYHELARRGALPAMATADG